MRIMLEAISSSFEKYLGPGDVRASMKSILFFVLKISITLMIIVAYALFLINMVLSLDVSWVDTKSGFLKIILNFMIILIPAIVLSGVAGYYYPGTKNHLIWRVVLNSYFIVALFLFSHAVEYSMSDLVVNLGYNLVVSSIDITVDITLILVILLIIPICSLIDSYMEYIIESSRKKSPL